jgi:hypothetical protein
MGDIDRTASLTFKELIDKYSALQKCVVTQIQNLASSISKASPGKFLLAQFGMSQVTQIGDSISNLIAQVNATINYAVRNQRAQ